MTIETEVCKCCGQVLHPDRIVWLEMSIDKKYSVEGVIPEHRSQGCFPFGHRCASKVLRDHSFVPA